MASSSASTVDAYLASLPPERQTAIRAVRAVVLANLPAGFEEGMQYGMIGYYVPLSRYPVTYNGQALGIAALASQKDYMALYLMAVHGDPELRASFERDYRASGKKLDMGKACVRFKSLADLPLDLVGRTIASIGVEAFLTRYEEIRAQTASGKAAAAKKTAKPVAKPAAKKVVKPASKSAKKAAVKSAKKAIAQKAAKPASKSAKKAVAQKDANPAAKKAAPRK